MTELEQRAAIVAAARRWIGTPYHHAADVIGEGCDCGMLLVRVFVDCGLVPAFDPRPYARDWHLHRSEESYLGFVFARAAEVAEPAPGDVVVFRHGRTYSHGGIVSIADPLTLVHASFPARMVLEEPLAGSPFAAKERRFFSYWKTRAEGTERAVAEGRSQPDGCPHPAFEGIQ